MLYIKGWNSLGQNVTIWNSLDQNVTIWNTTENPKDTVKVCVQSDNLKKLYQSGKLHSSKMVQPCEKPYRSEKFHSSKTVTPSGKCYQSGIFTSSKTG